MSQMDGALHDKAGMRSRPLDFFSAVRSRAIRATMQRSPISYWARCSFALLSGPEWDGLSQFPSFKGYAWRWPVRDAGATQQTFVAERLVWLRLR